MGQPSTHDLLKKINYLETDLEIQKQILFSIPSKNTEEMEKTVKVIADINQQIKDLRHQIEQQDPEEFARILSFENVVNQFKELARNKEFATIEAHTPDSPCTLTLTDGKTISCLIRACDKEGYWTAVSFDGKLLHYRPEEVTDKPPGE